MSVDTTYGVYLFYMFSFWSTSPYRFNQIYFIPYIPIKGKMPFFLC